MFGAFRARLRPKAAVHAPRLSDALSETGAYRTDYGAWQPLGLPGDPALVPDAPRAAADRVSQALIDSAPQRAAGVRAILAAQGVTSLDGPLDWEQAENVITRMAEVSREPSDAGLGTVLRPRYLAFLVDAGCAYALALCAAHPGARLLPAGAALSPFSTTGPVWPVIGVPGQDHVLRPFELVLEAGANAVLQGYSDILPRGFGPSGQAARPDGATLMADWLEAFLADHGRQPTLDEVAAAMVDDGIVPEDLPRSLLLRLGVAD